MAQKHKDHIVEILKRSGPLPYGTLKERVLNALQLVEDDYPKSTMQKHLEQLVDEAKISFKMQDKKRLYFVETHDHPVEGGLIIEQLGGRITASPQLLAFDVKIDKGQKEFRDQNKIHLFFEFNSTNICLSIHKEAYPFAIHISRLKLDNIHPAVTRHFGLRTITLELPVSTISSFKPENPSGHILLKFTANNTVEVTELGATNPAEHVQMSGLSLETFSREISVISAKTVRNEVDDRSVRITGRRPLASGEKVNISLPALLLLSIDSSVAIF